MNNHLPSVLRMPPHKKQAAIDAVDRAINILGMQMARREKLEGEITAEPLPDTLKSMSSYMALFSTVVMLIVGRTQQPYLKGRIRQWQVYTESQRIAAESGAPFDKIYETFMSLMTRYIRPGKYALFYLPTSAPSRDHCRLRTY